MYFPHQAEAFKRFLAELRGQRVAVLGHLRPDGDCIGSQVGLTRMLRALGIETVAVNKDPSPRALASFIGDTPFVLAKDFDETGYVSVNVDCADPIRVGKLLQGKFPRTLANIDHHVSNTGYATHDFVEPQTAATGEVLAGLAFDHDIPLDAVAAQALYVAIATDTGQFRLPTTSGQVFEVCSRLCAQGASPEEMARELFENEPVARLKLLERFLGSVKLELGGRVAIGTLRENDFAETGASQEDAEGFVDYVRDLKGVDIGILLEEYDRQVKGSLRAKARRWRVNELARQFNGGGHAPAAGFNQECLLDELLPRLMPAVEAHLETIDAAVLTAENAEGAEQ